MKKLGLFLVLIVILSLGMRIYAISTTDLEKRISEGKENLARLDYTFLDKEIENLRLLEDKVKKVPLGEATELQAEIEKRLGEAYLKTYESLKLETRAIWIDNIYLANIKSRAEVKQMMDWLASMNFNVIIPDVYNQGQSIYPSKVVPQFDSYKVFYQGDILADMVAEAHAHGLEIHPLIVTFGLDAGFDLFIDNIDWFDKDLNGKLINTYGQAFLSPAVPQVRDRQIALIKEIAAYNVDGFQLDYIRFSQGFGYGDYISKLFRSLYGRTPKEIGPYSPLFPRYQEFKAQFISTFVDRAVKEVAAINPHAVVSAAVQSPYTWGFNDLGQDWKHWLDNRFIHSLMLMSYTLNASETKTIIETDLNHSENKGLLLPGMGLYNWGGEELLKQIATTRELPFTGQVSFSALHLKEDMEAMLKAGPYRERSQPTLRNPQKIAADYLLDLALRIGEVGELAGLSEKTITSWQDELQRAALNINNLNIRPFPERDLQEANVIEYEIIKKQITKLESLRDEAKKVGKPGKRMQLEIGRTIGLLKTLKYLSAPYNYRSIKY